MAHEEEGEEDMDRRHHEAGTGPGADTDHPEAVTDREEATEEALHLQVGTVEADQATLHRLACVVRLDLRHLATRMTHTTPVHPQAREVVLHLQ